MKRTARRPSSLTLKLVALLSLLAAGSASAAPDPKPASPPAAAEKRIPKVQIAILLDNSGSMEGLINQARSQIWKVVNTFATAKRDGVRPRLELALYEYGDGVKRLSGFTTNLDAISERLFSLGIRGGDEYCGQVIQSATHELEWSGNDDDLKLIYIAGNEPFTQGPVDYRSAIAQAKRKNITVNVILCGDKDPTWKAGAMAAAGDYFEINQNAVAHYVPAPQDKEIARLGGELNKTYVGYGKAGGHGAAMQAAQDSNAVAAAPSAAVTRSIAKSSAMYDNSGWDLVDAARKGEVAVDKMKDDELPAEMKPMSAEDRKAYVVKKDSERTALQQKIADLSKQREAFLAEEAKKAGGGDSTLDTAITNSVRTQGEKKAFKF